MDIGHKNNYMNPSFLDYLVLFFMFFPFVGIVPGVDVQPVFTLLGFFLLLSKRVVLSSVSIFVVTFSSVYFLTSLFFYYSWSGVNDVITVIFSIVTAYVIHLLLISKSLDISLSFVLTVLCIYVSVGFVQLFYPGFLEFMISRDNVAMLELTGRGVRSLSGEPSHFGKILIMLSVFAVFFFIDKKIRSSMIIFFMLLIIVVSVLLPSSFYMVFFHFVIFLMLVILLSVRVFISSVLICSSLVYAFVLYYADADGRFFFILNALVSNFDVIMQQGAFDRVMNVPISLYGFFYNFPFGTGVEISDSIHSFNILGSDYSFVLSDRNLGGFVEFIMRFGLFSMPFYVMYFYILWSISRFFADINGRRIHIGLFYSFSIFLLTFFDGSPSNPLSWFLLLFFYNQSQKYNKSI